MSTIPSFETGTGVLTPLCTLPAAPLTSQQLGYEVGERGFSSPCASTGGAVNQAPVVDAGPDQTINLAASAQLAGQVSDDGLPGYGQLMYGWSQTAGPGSAIFSNAASLSSTVAFSAVGAYTLTLTASDGELTASSTVNITVTLANQPPVVSVGADQTITIPGNVTLTGVVTDDGLPNGTLTYSWTQLSGPAVTITNATALVASVSLSAAGSYVFRLTASDGQLSGTATTTVTATALVGFAPPAGLIQGADGNLYGVNYSGGTGGGTLYKSTPAGSVSNVHSFVSADGTQPFSSLFQATDGNFYGVGLSSVYKVTPQGVATKLHDFGTSLDDGYPYLISAPGIMQASDGNLYGCTYRNGANGGGQVFKVTLGGTFLVLYSPPGEGVGMTTFGSLAGTPVQGADGKLYVPAQYYNNGGFSNAGCILAVALNGTATVLSVFPDAMPNPTTPLTLATDGNFYGVTQFGIIYRMTPTGTLSQVATLSGNLRATGLIQATDGNLYGCVSGGGTSGLGFIYRATLAGGITILHSFNQADGRAPNALLQAGDGYLYGTTQAGGANGSGGLYRISTSGVFASLNSFSANN